LVSGIFAICAIKTTTLIVTQNHVELGRITLFIYEAAFLYQKPLNL